MAESPKKPNSFSKGMMSDIDANILPSDTYKSATNARLITREDNSFVLKNAKGNAVFDTLVVSTIASSMSTTTILGNTTIANFTNPSVKGFQIVITGNSGFTLVTKSFNSGDTSSLGNVLSTSTGAKARDFLYQCIVKALEEPTVTAKMSISVTYGFTSAADSSISIVTEALTSEVMTISYRPFISYTVSSELTQENYAITNGNGYTSVSYAGTVYSIVGMANFSDYIIALTTASNINVEDAIFKITINNDGSLGSRSILLKSDLGLTDKTSLRIEVSEENEHFHRIYWTDGVNPLRTLNLKEDASYYANLTANDLNVFKESKLLAPNVTNIIGGGNVSCGSHSYCYRLVTTDGKTSRVSAITNPIQILKTSPLSDYHESLGGSLDTSSVNAVQLSINGINKSYSTIQLIDITYTSSEGAITANIISESIITSSSFNYTHNGNETKVSLSIGELLRSHVSWDVCADLAIKDNRLFAANLKNNADSIDLDFRVKSYKYPDSNGTGTAATYDTQENPNIHADTMYLDGNYGWINAAHAVKVPGAETVGFASATDGVRVTFATKTFDLTKVQYFGNSETLNTSSNTDKAETTVGRVPHYGFLDQAQESGYKNYKNPIFTKDYTGYQRGEVYRFGILFYDKAGNSGFVSPIGDIRMPDGIMDYVSNNSSGSRVTQNDDGVTTFKHAGNIPNRSYSWAWSGATATTLNKIGGGVGVNVHDVVSGTGIAPHTTVISVAGDNNSIVIGRATTAVGTATTLTFDTTTDDVKGFALYPQFNVKLSEATRAKISGYSIVRVDRTESDKSVLGSGVINQSIIHANVSGNGSLRHKNGHHFGNIYSGRQSHECLSDADFTLDSPEITLGKLQYTRRDEDKIKVVGRLDAGAEDLTDESFPHDSNITNEDDFKHLKQRFSSDGIYTGNILSGRFNPNSNTADNGYQYTQKVIYNQFKSSVAHVKTATEAQSIKGVEYGEVVSPGASVDKGRMGFDNHGTGRTGHNFTNRCRFNTDTFVFSQFPEATDTEKYDSGAQNDGQQVTLFGVTSLFFSLGPDSGDQIEHSDFEIGTSNAYTFSPFVLNRKDATRGAQVAYASKLYVQLKRNVSEFQYGGSSTSNYESNQYISTGHVSFTPTDNNFDTVFGGDTYINMYSLRKWHIGSTTFSSKAFPSTAIIFPVESSVNIDLRDGVFFGATDELSAVVEDNFFINETYGSRNTNKTFLQKPANFKDVNSYSNLIAASNLKLAGNLFDAFTTWDANEIHELSNNKGAIYSIFNLRNELFAIQQNAVSKLSINPRVVVDNADAAAVTVVTGTGQVIQRSDYIDTMYGSQHFNNMLVTNTSAYWYDNNMSSFCKLVLGKGIAVQDLGITTQNSSIFNALKNSTIGDKPLDYSVGGIALYYNKIFDEIGICITTANNGSVTHLVYSELNDLMVSKKEDVICMAANLPGELLTIGRNNATTSINSSKLYKEDSNNSYISYYEINNTNSLDVTFVCNEKVYSSKKFDKLVMYLSGNENAQKFTTFTFTDSVSNTAFTSNASLSRTANGKHIIPITSTDGTAKATGQYLIIQTKSTNTGLIELFGALVHNRTTT